MSKRRKTRKNWIEILIISLACVAVAVLVGIYVYTQFRASATKNMIENQSDRYYSVLYVDYDDTLILSDMYGEGLVRKLPVEPTREGYTFAGWTSEDSNSTLTTEQTQKLIIVKDTLFRAVYNPIMQTVRYLDNDYSTIAELEYTFEEELPKIANPQKEGYFFTGWDTSVNGKVTTKVAMYLEEDSKYYYRVGTKYYQYMSEALVDINKLNQEINYLDWVDGVRNDTLPEDRIIYLFRDNYDYQDISSYQYITLRLVDNITMYGGWATQYTTLSIGNSYVYIDANDYALTLTTDERDTSYPDKDLFTIVSNQDTAVFISGSLKIDGKAFINSNEQQSELKYPITLLDGEIVCKDFSIVKNNLALRLEGDSSLDMIINWIPTEYSETDYLVVSDNLLNKTIKVNVNVGVKYLKTGLKDIDTYNYRISNDDMPFEVVSEEPQTFGTDITEQATGTETLVFNARYLNTQLDETYTQIKISFAGFTSIETSNQFDLIFTKGDDGIYRTNITTVEYISSMTIELTAIKPTLMITVQGNGEWYYETLIITKIEAR